MLAIFRKIGQFIALRICLRKSYVLSKSSIRHSSTHKNIDNNDQNNSTKIKKLTQGDNKIAATKAKETSSNTMQNN